MTLDEAADAVERAIEGLSTTHQIQVLLHMAAVTIAHDVAKQDRAHVVEQAADYLDQMVRETEVALAAERKGAH